MRGFPVYAMAAAVGAVAGLRSLTPPAVVSWSARSGRLRLKRSRLRFLRSELASKVLVAAAAGELVADKVPSIPRRTKAGPLAGRIVSGALCGAAICAAGKQPPVTGALVGGLAAIGGAFGGYELRRFAVQQWHVPDWAAAAVEDAVAIGGSIAVVRAVA